MKKLILIAFFLISWTICSQEQTFDIVVLRSVTSNPTTSLTGGPLKVGSLIFNSSIGKVLSYDGNSWEPLALFSEIPANKQLSLASNILALEDGGTVDLSPYLDYNATDSAKVGNLPSNQGSVNSDFESRIAVNDLKNGITASQISNIITNNAKVGITPQQVSDIQSNNAKVSGDGSVSNNSDVDGSGASNGQVLKWNSTNSRWEASDDNVGGAGSDGNDFPTSATLSGNNLTIVIPNQSNVVVDVSSLLDNTDGQTITDLSLSGNNLSITVSGGNTETVDLSSLSGAGGSSDVDFYEAGTITAPDAITDDKVTQGKVGIGDGTTANALNYKLNLFSLGTTPTYMQIANGQTGFGAGDGLFFGTNADGSALIYNGENTPLTFYTNGTSRFDILGNGTLDAKGNLMVNLADPTTNQGAATKNYVDSKSGSGVVISGSPVNNQLAFWSSSSTLAGDPNLTWTGSNFNVVGNFTATTLVGSGSALPLQARGLGVIGDNTAQSSILGKDSADSSMWFIGDSSTSNNDILIYNYSGGSYLNIQDGGSINGLKYFDGTSLNNVWHAGNTHTHAASNIVGLTATAPEINLLDLSGLTAGWVLSADSSSSASWKPPSGGGTDDQTGAEVTIADVGGYWPSGNVEGALQDVGAEIATLPINTTQLPYSNGTSGLPSTTTQGAIDDLAAASASGISSENQARINKQNQIDSYLKTADFLWSPSDVEVATGTSTNGMKSIVTNETGTSIEGAMEDADVLDNQIIVVRNIGPGSEIVNYIVENDTDTFRSLDGTAGNEWTVPESSQCTGTEEGGVITVDCGTVSTRSFTPVCSADPNEAYVTSNALSDLNCNEIDSVSGFANSNGTSFASVADDGTNGSDYKIQFTANSSGSLFANINVAVDNGATYVVKVVGRNTSGTNGGLHAWTGITASRFYNDFFTSSWTEKTYTVTTDATTLGIRVYPAISSGVSGNQCEVRSITVIKQ